MSTTVLASSALPVAVVGGYLFLYGVDLPFLDQWAVAALLQRLLEGTMTLGDLVAPHNEHRPFFPRLLWLGLARVTGYDVNAQLWLNLAIGVGLFAFFVRRCRRTWAALGVTAPAWLIPLMSLLVFNLGAREHWLQGIQTIMVLEIACVVVGFFLLAEGSGWRHYWSAVGLGVVANGTMAAGPLYWPVGLLVLAMVPSSRVRTTRAVLWVAVGGACIALQGLAWSSTGPLRPVDLGAAPALTLWMLSFLGAPMMTVPWVAVAFGLTSVVLYAVLMRRAAATGQWTAYAPYVATALFVLLTGIAIAFGRFEAGIAQSVVSRYLAVSAWYWACLLALLPALGLPRGPQAAFLGACAAVLTVHTIAGGWRGHVTLYQRIQPVHAAVLLDRDLTDEVLKPVTSRPDEARRLLAFLRARRLSVYGDRS